MAGRDRCEGRLIVGRRRRRHDVELRPGAVSSEHEKLAEERKKERDELQHGSPTHLSQLPQLHAFTLSRKTVRSPHHSVQIHRAIKAFETVKTYLAIRLNSDHNPCLLLVASRTFEAHRFGHGGGDGSRSDEPEDHAGEPRRAGR